MEPTLLKGQLVIASRMETVGSGDVVALYYNNQILLRRIIGISGDVINIDRNGIVSVNGVEIEEGYLDDRTLGLSDISYPYAVPENSYFVMGDNRELSVDSRLSAVGCINHEKIAGKIIFSIWPIHRAGYIGWGD